MDMVEKVARALCASTGTIWGGPRGEDDPDWRMVKAMFYRQARAALEAMREPSDDMILAGSKYYHDNWRVDHAREDTNAQSIWQAMIDAALTPTR